MISSYLYKFQAHMLDIVSTKSMDILAYLYYNDKKVKELER